MAKTVDAKKISETEMEYFGVAGHMGIDPDHYPDVLAVEGKAPWPGAERPRIYFFLICRIDGGAFYRSMMGTPLTVWAF